jgi:hypothetical protein
MYRSLTTYIVGVGGSVHNYTKEVIGDDEHGCTGRYVVANGRMSANVDPGGAGVRHRDS